MKHILRPAFGLLLAAGLTLSASAAEIDSQDVYCFGAEQFSPGETELAGICLTQLPEKSQGLLMLGERLLRPGDVLTARLRPAGFHCHHLLSAGVCQRSGRGSDHDPVHPGPGEQGPDRRGLRL